MKIKIAFIIILLTISLIEYLKRINFKQSIIKIKQNYLSIIQIIFDKTISDETKEKVIPREAIGLFKSSFKLLISLLSLIIIIIIFNEILNLISINLINDLLSLWGMLISFSTIFIYSVLKKSKA